jgi:hypothetical protein
MPKVGVIANPGTACKDELCALTPTMQKGDEGVSAGFISLDQPTSCAATRKSSTKTFIW